MFAENTIVIIIKVIHSHMNEAQQQASTPKFKGLLKADEQQAASDQQ